MSTTMNKIKSRLLPYNIQDFTKENNEIVNFKYYSNKFPIFNPYCLYVMKSSNLPQYINSNMKINFLIIEDIEIPNYITSCKKYSSIVLKENTLPIFKIIYILQDIFKINSSLLSFQEDLINLIGKNCSIDEILKVAYNYLKNPILLLNSMYHTCSYYLGNTELDDPSWKYQLKEGIPHPQYSVNYNNSKENRKLSSNCNEIITTFFPEVMNYKEITIPIKHGSFCIGRISILECNKTFTSDDENILKILGKLIYPKLLIDKRFLVTNDPKFDSIMNYLINSDIPNEILVRDTLNSLGISISNNMYLLHLSDIDNINSITKMLYIKQIIQSVFPTHIVFIYKNNIIVIYDNKNSYKDFTICSEYKLFIEIIKNYTLKVGVSSLFNNIYNIKKAYNQAVKSISFGELNTNKKDLIYYFDDYIVNNLISTFIYKDSLNNIIDSKLKKLILDNNSDLFYTLNCYIKCDCDTKLTSNKLNIHYNTLKYRLQKIKNLYSIDLNDSTYIVKLKLCFLALDMKKSGGFSLVNNN